MSTEQINDLEFEISQMTPEDRENDYKLLQFQIRFWKQKAWRTEQQLGREVELRIALEKTLEKYKDVTEDILVSIKKSKVEALKAEADSYFSKIGIVKWSIIKDTERNLKCLNDELVFWQNIVSIYKEKKNTDDSD